MKMFIKPKKRVLDAAQVIVSLLILFFVANGCAAPLRYAAVQNTPSEDSVKINHGFTRTVDVSDFENLAFDEWTLEYEPTPQRKHTLLIYMNGSDLESETAAGTGDLKELTRSGVDETYVNVVIFTGGANRWHTNAVPSGECAVSVLCGGEITQIGTVGQRDMGNAGTLASFISFGLQAFPAEETSLILWDHGGGSIAGYGADENFDMSTLSLTELEYAFERAGLRDKPLALLGFDACLMATVEMAVVASSYAEYLLASENVEPGDGWDYRTVAVLPDASIEEFAVNICNSFAENCRNSREEFTLSLIKTETAADVMGALGLLAKAATASDFDSGFTLLRSSRQNTKTFGAGTPDSEPCDMIDILDFTRLLEEKLPNETALIQKALQNTVLFNVYCSDAELGGLSVYHPYSEREDLWRSLEVYKSLKMSGEYTRYLTEFSKKLGAGADKPVAAPELTHLFGGSTNMYEVSATDDGTIFAVQATVNGEPAELLVYRAVGLTASSSGDELLGYRRRDGSLLQKGYDELTPEDEVSLREEGF